MGTIELSIDAMALSISVSAIAKRNAGRNDPKNPDRANHFQSDLEMVLSRLKPATKRKKPVTMVRKAPI